jgi:hypothetical protein
MHLGYKKRTTCSDESIFDTFLPIFKEKWYLYKDNFDSLYNDIMVQSGMRDTNLEGLIEDILTNSKKKNEHWTIRQKCYK